MGPDWNEMDKELEQVGRVMNQSHTQGLSKRKKGKATLRWTINNSHTTRLKILCTFVFMKAAVSGEICGP